MPAKLTKWFNEFRYRLRAESAAEFANQRCSQMQDLHKPGLAGMYRKREDKWVKIASRRGWFDKSFGEE